MTIIHRTCTICEANCGLSYELQGGRVAHVRPDDEDVLSHGYACPKGIANAELHTDPDRLRAPMRRTPSGQFEPIGWDEAIASAVEGLKRVRTSAGANGVATYFGNPIVHNPAALLVRTGLIRAIGTRNSFSAGSQDTSPRFATSYHLYGSSFTIPIPDLERTDYLLCLGANPRVSNGSFLTAPGMRDWLRGLQRRGGKLVVVDPRRSETAVQADEHVAILPGGDAALLLGMVRELLTADLVDLLAVRELARGFDDAAQQVRALDPERLASACGVAHETIARLAHEFASAKTSVAYSRIGICNNRHGTLATWATDLLNLAAGRLAQVGGAMFARPALDLRRLLAMPGMDGHGRFHSRVRQLPETLGDLPAACMAEEIETPGHGQIRGLLTYAGNPVLSVPNGRRLGRALADLDFMVSIDLYINETTRHADIILPPASPLTEEHMDLVFPTVMIRNVARVSPGIAPKGEGERHDWEILRALAEGMGGGMTGTPLDGPLRWLRWLGAEVGPMGILDGLLRTGPHGDRFLPVGRGLSVAKLRKMPHGVDLGGLESGVKDLIRHRDRSVHVDAEPIMTALREFGSSLSEPVPGDHLLLVGRREILSNNSWLHNLPSLVNGKARCRLRVHPSDAQAAGLVDGEAVWMQSRVHVGQVPIEVSDEMRPGVVSLPHGWGHQEVACFQRAAGEVPGVSINDWTDDGRVEAVVGQSILNGVPVRLHRTDPRARGCAPASTAQPQPMEEHR
ncbi:MAG: molybdopterin-dependent oxidoreductase [Myxococcales bacterium]|nr:molybdopterin-dependent oxidoreductase [Myxococcales bacterium]